MTISTPGKTVDGTIAAIVFPSVEGWKDTVELHTKDVDSVNGTVTWRFDVVNWVDMILFCCNSMSIWNSKIKSISW